MIFSLIKLVMRKCGLTQKALADVLGVSVDRVKSITSGKVQKLTREESEALVKKLHIRAEWLVTGQGPMFQSASEQEFQSRLDALAIASQQAASAGMTREQADLLQQSMVAAQSLPPYGLSDDEAALLAGYRRSSSEVQAAALRMLAGEPPKPRPRIPKPARIVEHVSDLPPKKFAPPKKRGGDTG